MKNLPGISRSSGGNAVMSEEYGPDLLTLVDEEGQEHEFEVLDVIDNDNGTFYALLPTFDDPEDKVNDEGTYYIFQSIDENGEQELAEVEDDNLLSGLAKQFEAHFAELYPDEGEAFDDDSDK
jgi:uncharacterized protein YrzB (UPF0473 family)